MSSQGIQSWYIGIGNIPLLVLKAKIGQSDEKKREDARAGSLSRRRVRGYCDELGRRGQMYRRMIKGGCSRSMASEVPAMSGGS